MHRVYSGINVTPHPQHYLPPDNENNSHNLVGNHFYNSISILAQQPLHQPNLPLEKPENSICKSSNIYRKTGIRISIWKLSLPQKANNSPDLNIFKIEMHLIYQATWMCKNISYTMTTSATIYSDVHSIRNLSHIKGK